MTQYQKHTTRNVLLIVLVCAVLALPAFWVVTLGYTGVRSFVAGREKHEVVYKVTGTAKNPSVRYLRDGHRDNVALGEADLPWQSEPLTVKGSNQYLSVYALQQNGDRGSVNCEIWVDGKLVERNDPSAPSYLAADCTYTP
ncbi:hypothetical protein [Kribbella sp. NPDC004536]|uniref:hypothetical protein n=1 Tax=Kribbella sp. NPDC004536 TaxID=3364106 RepID=UPI0036A88118